MTTDGYVVDPPFFPGGDIGRLSIFGTCNDLAVSGAKPLCISLALVIEEGFPVDDLRRALASAAEAAREADARIVTGDTKVVPRGKGGGLFITTAGVGRRVFPFPSVPGARPKAGDAVIISAPVGAHGLTVLAARESLPVADALRSDMACLFPAVSALFPLAEKLHFMRDATRGGISSVLNEIVSRVRPGESSWRRRRFPVSDEVRTVASLLGSEPAGDRERRSVRRRRVGRCEGAARSTSCTPTRWAGSARCVGARLRGIPGARAHDGRGSAEREGGLSPGLLLPRIC